MKWSDLIGAGRPKKPVKREVSEPVNVYNAEKVLRDLLSNEDYRKSLYSLINEHMEDAEIRMDAATSDHAATSKAIGAFFALRNLLTVLQAFQPPK